MLDHRDEIALAMGITPDIMEKWQWQLGYQAFIQGTAFRQDRMNVAASREIWRLGWQYARRERLLEWTGKQKPGQ
jgi:hypothetical protein